MGLPKLAVLVALALSFTATPSTPARAQAPSRAALEKKVQALQALESTEAWRNAEPKLSRFERSYLARHAGELPATLPEFWLDPHGLKLRIGKVLEADFSRVQDRLLYVNDTAIEIPERTSVFQLAKRIDEALGKRAPGKGLGWNTIFGIPAAQADSSVDDSCLGDWEFAYRSPYALLDSKLGYFGKLLVAGISMGFVQPARKIFARCGEQVAELQALLKEQNLGMKDFECGSEESGSDRSITFWTPETGDEGEFKTKKFDLDYAQWLAQERSEDDEDDAKKSKKKTKEKIFVFGVSQLEEVRYLDEDEKNNRFQCKTVTAKETALAKEASYVEPYRKIFAYMGNHDTCGTCRKEATVQLRSPKAPDYFPAPPKKKKARRAGPEPEPVSPPEQVGPAD